MKMSRRARRMQRHHRRHRGTAFNMISLMDIFTILVFFLLVNSAEVQIQPVGVKLPESLAEIKPRETTLVTITGSEVLVQGRVVASVEDLHGGAPTAAAGEDDPLLTALRPLAIPIELGAEEGGRIVAPEVTIAGDRQTPFSVLRRVMASCSAAGFAHISLSVVQRSAATEG